ncbi:MAG: VOC family protein [Candidatus Binatia bacterium]
MKVPHVPAGHNAVSPYLVTQDAEQVICMLHEVFGGEEIHRSLRPDGTIRHAEVRIEDSVIMIGEASGEFPAMPCMLHVYVPDCDATHARARSFGLETLREPETQPWGDRSAGVRDGAGNQWWFATHVEDVGEEELARRMQAAAS